MLPQPQLIGIGTEAIYSFIIIVCSFMIYFATKELYDLTSHKGIKYFRFAFLFFALSYIARLILEFLVMFFDAQRVFDLTPIFGLTLITAYIYLSTMSLFFLLQSVLWKHWHKRNLYLLHVIAIFVALLTILFNNPLILFLINVFLFLILIFIIIMAYRQSLKKGLDLYLIYILLFIFWILNIINLLIPRFLEIFQLLIYFASAGIFFIILYKVLKKVGSN